MSANANTIDDMYGSMDVPVFSKIIVALCSLP